MRQQNQPKSLKHWRIEWEATMECRVCGQDNPDEASFCGNCGAALATGDKAATLPATPGQAVAAPVVAAAYAGFWIRFAAALIDAAAVGVVSWLLSFLVNALHVFFSFYWLSQVLPPLPILLLYYWLFTGLKGQTPGKMACRIKVVDAQGNTPGLGVAALREIVGKLISTIVLCVGFLWIASDDHRQGWHDKIANTHVVRVESPT